MLFYICLQIVFSANGSATQSHAKNAYIIAVLVQKASAHIINYVATAMNPAFEASFTIACSINFWMHTVLLPRLF